MFLDSPWEALEKRAPPSLPPPHAIHPHDAIAQAQPKPTTAPKPKPTTPKPTVKPPVVSPVVPPVSSSSSSVSPISSISSTDLGSSSSDPVTTTASTHPPGAESAGGPVTTTPANNTGLIAGIAAGAVVVVLVIGGLVLRSRRRRNRAARDVEEYQQRAMMNKYSERNGSSMNSGSGVDGFGSSASLSRVMGKQPDWFAQKSPLEYYRQVPPLTELQKQTPHPSLQHRPYLKHETSAKSGHSSASTSSYQGSQKLKKSSSQTELIPLTSTGASPKVLPSPLKPYQQQQYQQPRLSTNLRSTTSPTSPTSPTYLGSLSPNSNRPQQSPFPTLATSPISPLPPALPSNSLYTYHPPPPSMSPVSPSLSKPSAGFYDFLMDDEDVKDDSKTKNQSVSGSKGAGKPGSPTGTSPTTRAPPPVPRATRPISVISTSSLKLKESGELKLDDSAPAVPSLPKPS
ncbi:hypothetical protein BG003_000007 [Podila horticola]|nr:hypothetical protein BG003_000007 [Podila horticola]